ncbi:MAG TPA: oligopeptide ABC transporter permease [Atopostipes sp.]|nr:oligopeptide ABC transporter permease [Atopostipes sp.]
MWKTVLRRLLTMIPQIILLSIIVFVVAREMPGDAFTGMIDPNVDPAQIEALREAAGWNDPVSVQYVRWIGDVLQGDFGRSYAQQVPVTTLIGGRAANSLRLGIVSTFFTYLIALPFGMFAGRFNNSWFDRFVVIYNYVSYAIPTFVLALLMVFIFGYRLGWFPTFGSKNVTLTAGTFDYYWDMFYRLLLPGFTGGILGTASTTQTLRSEVIDAKTQDYVRTARSKGVPEGKIFSKHIFRNAVLPIASSFGFIFSSLLSGSVFIEQIFAFNGMGDLFITSINARDYSVVITLTLLYGILAILGSLISDIALSLADPRIRID